MNTIMRLILYGKLMKILDIQTSSGREIYLSHNPEDYIGDGSFYSKEIQYLLDAGYKFVDEGGIWHAIRK